MRPATAILALGLTVGSVAPAGAQSVTPADSAVREDVVVLPFANLCGRYDGLESILPVFYEKLDALGLRVVSHEELRPILREHRVRVVGRIGTRGMDVVREATGARLAIVGSLDIFEPDSSFEILISARLVDLESRRVLKAISVGNIVQETERVFGLGRAEEIESVIDPVVDDFMRELGPAMRGELAPRTRYHSCGLVALIPLDDYSERRHGAGVLENLLMAELVSRDFTVVEPGVLQEVFLDAQSMARGGIGLRALAHLRDELGVCFALTGELEFFDLSRSALDISVPRIGYGLRLIDARTGRLVAAINQTRNGFEGETLFARGREYSMARLARTSLQNVLDWMEEQGERKP